MLAVLLPFSDDPVPWLATLGRAHLVLLHAPLGILPAIALLEFGAALLRRPAPRGPVLALCCFAAITGALAAASGLLLAQEDYEGDTVATHRVLGIVLASLLVLATVFSLLEQRRPFRIILLVSLLVMFPTGHFGGTLTHGADFLFPKVRTKPLPAVVTTGPLANGELVAGEFSRSIAPILERTCIKCHNPDKKKGELLLTTVEGISAGGENGPVVVAGKPDESPLLLRCELPLDHDDHMPPPEKPQPTAAEIATLRAWIAGGASF